MSSSTSVVSGFSPPSTLDGRRLLTASDAGCQRPETAEVARFLVDDAAGGASLRMASVFAATSANPRGKRGLTFDAQEVVNALARGPAIGTTPLPESPRISRDQSSHFASHPPPYPASHPRPATHPMALPPTRPLPRPPSTPKQKHGQISARLKQKRASNLNNQR